MNATREEDQGQVKRKKKEVRCGEEFFALCTFFFSSFIIPHSSFILCSSDRIVDNVADLTVAIYDHQTDQRVENLNKW